MDIVAIVVAIVFGFWIGGILLKAMFGKGLEEERRILKDISDSLKDLTDDDNGDDP